MNCVIASLCGLARSSGAVSEARSPMVASLRAQCGNLPMDCVIASKAWQSIEFMQNFSLLSGLQKYSPLQGLPRRLRPPRNDDTILMFPVGPSLIGLATAATHAYSPYTPPGYAL
jgi:hypothetical protein